ncbi:hypothetical protein PHYBLDRAFT_79537 [Phycomyces blakesleeanus NRRL 1555(-)]|uniref:IPT/TIG domain-containing protein n=1 Tax=Phycomyces blakesleeanus (strain ATCC 8743b / DSM 1359 / FGSC 10004 / NBRC 33097 / NRRL 1555) TaxID=763407 RepID=A0A162TS79_PHYB8|nr:hypothetical protein PHYBLDRAFT_79537 [Phycomyces blakesleeanus NRRL 1555(-)]OAD70632.1 hypothetical protein PHYBLDRAFT_79537 [Phycomyces blakesleeanus NRRL 1555(-)]|eukprot:XP_018288672.1 hypothetical protein PHYBLDRAFT_79537 [Phycomyces blakesleeanus NRRL 1555(-)]
MQNTSPLTTMSLASNDFYDSPSGSSTSEPHDDLVNILNPLIDNSFFYKLDHLSTKNPMFFMHNQKNETRHDNISSAKHMDQSSPYNYHTPSLATPTIATQSRIIESLHPVNSPAESNQTFWSGFNNIFTNVTNNSIPPTIPSLAKNFSDYISHSPVHLPNPVYVPTSLSSLTPHVGSPRKCDESLDTPFSHNTLTPSLDPTTKGMQIRVLGVPQTGAKSRVETQIKLCIQLVTDDGDKSQWWSHLKLPRHMVAKERLKRQSLVPAVSNNIKMDSTDLLVKPERTLFLSARVICASNPSKKVVTCLGCIQRERKRSQRRKENRVKTDTDDEKSPTEDEESLALEEEKVLLFNCPDMVDFSSGDTILPTRITCYCRHHNERLGFCIYFEMHDHTGKQVATGVSPAIMITDDHKSNKSRVGQKRQRADIEAPKVPLMPAESYEPYQELSSNESNSGSRRFRAAYRSSPTLHALHEHKSPQPLSFIELSPPRNEEHSTNIVRHESYDIPVEPKALTRLMLPTVVSQGHEISLVSDTSHPKITAAVASNEGPQLKRIIPSEGPTCGGIEVTILGSGFHPGLTCLFGDIEATSTHYWSQNTIVCILPPAAESGTAVVSFKEHPLPLEGDVTLFKYYSENDRALMELALQVVGLKMTGKVEEARKIAIQIVQNGGGHGHQASNETTSDSNTQNRHKDMSSSSDYTPEIKQSLSRYSAAKRHPFFVVF